MPAGDLPRDRAGDDLPEVDDLFALPPEAFTAERDALARRLRTEGDREAAAAVKRLRRPTVAAWALNQLVRRHPDDAAALVRAGQELADAQQEALGGSAARLREATRARSALLRHLSALADDVLGDHGSDAHQRDVVATLTAASSDPDAGAALLAGRLSEALAAPSGFPVGLDAGGTATPAPAPATRPTATEGPAKAAKRARKPTATEAATARAAGDAAAEEALATAERALQERRAAAEQAAAAAAEARAAAAAAQADVDALAAELETARAAAVAAATAAAEAEARAREAADEVAQAAEARDRLAR